MLDAGNMYCIYKLPVSYIFQTWSITLGDFYTCYCILGISPKLNVLSVCILPLFKEPPNVLISYIDQDSILVVSSGMTTSYFAYVLIKCSNEELNDACLEIFISSLL